MLLHRKPHDFLHAAREHSARKARAFVLLVGLLENPAPIDAPGSACHRLNLCTFIAEVGPIAIRIEVSALWAMGRIVCRLIQATEHTALLRVKLLFRRECESHLVLYLELARASHVFALWPFSGMGDVVTFVYRDNNREWLIVGHWSIPFGTRGWIRAPSLIQRLSDGQRVPRVQRRRCEP